MEDVPTQPRLTRAGLYECVWSTPVNRLFEQFGITNFSALRHLAEA